MIHCKKCFLYFTSNENELIHRKHCGVATQIFKLGHKKKPYDLPLTEDGDYFCLFGCQIGKASRRMMALHMTLEHSRHLGAWGLTTDRITPPEKPRKKPKIPSFAEIVEDQTFINDDWSRMEEKERKFVKGQTRFMNKLLKLFYNELYDKHKNTRLQTVKNMT